jgi:hypothetical protein
VDAEAFKAQVASGKGDGELLEWIEQNAKPKRSIPEIATWSKLQSHRVPSDIDSREYFQGLHKQVAPNRSDIVTWFDLLDVDDYASFGGKP